MSSITATRTSRFAPPTTTPRTQTRKPTTGRRTVGQAGQAASVSRSDRPVLRIVTSRPAPVEHVGATTTPPLALLPAPPRRVDLADFFVAEYDGDDISLEIGRPRASGLRLTRRGRLVVVGAGLAAALGLGFLAATSSLANDKPEPTRVVTVQPGQTLWGIASGITTGGDVRATMSHLEALNHLDSPALQAGQQLRVPR